MPYIDPAEYGPYVANQATTYANREPDFNKAMIGVLKTIQYPTGGSSTLIYEGNDYSRSDGIGGPKAKRIQKTALANAKKSGTINIPSSITTFSIDQGQNVSVTAVGSYSGAAPVENGPSLYLSKINTDGSRTNILQLFLINNTQNYYPFLDTGNYELKATVDGSIQNSQGTVVYYAADTVAAHLIHIFTTGGIRLRKQLNTDPVTGNQNAKVYSYRSASDTLSSSGVLVSDYLILDRKDSYAFTCGFLVRTSSSANYLGATQGSHIGYGVVTEKDSGSINVGKKESYFYTSADFPNLFTTQQHISSVNFLGETSQNKRNPNDFDVLRGYISKEFLYNGAGAIIRSTVNNYNFGDILNHVSPNYYEASAIAGYMYYICSDGCAQCAQSGNHFACDDYALNNFTLANYKVLCPWIYKTNTITVSFDQNGQNQLTDTVSYYYENPLHGEVTKTLTTNSKGDSLKSINIYASDKSKISGLDAISSSTLDSMVSRNMIASVIQEEHYIKNNLVSRARTDYKIWPLIRRNIAPAKIWYQVGANAIENRINFIAYDSNNNVVQVAKANDVNEVYFWGYKSQYPVVKVTGSDSATISSFVDKTILDNATGNNTDQQMRDELNKIRTGLANTKALVTTFTYSPLIGVTSETDPAGKTTFYEYDGLNRLKNIKDYQGNIIKNFQYNYANSCGANCVVLPMQTFMSYNTPSYPVGVFNINKQYIDTARTPAEYVTRWNSNAANQAIGVLSTNADSLHFNLNLAANAVAPPVVYGLRYFQWDTYTPNTVHIATDTTTFIDWGDGSRQLVTLPRQQMTEGVAYPNTNNQFMYYAIWLNHTYASSQPRTITIFHNETTEMVGLGNDGINDAAGQDANIRGFYPEKVKGIALDQIPNSSDLGIKNFDKLTEVVNIHYRIFWNSTPPVRHNNFHTINHMHKMRWLKITHTFANEIFTDMRTNFPSLQYVEFGLFKPDIVQTWSGIGFPNLRNLSIGMALTSSETDLILNSQAAGNNITNGFMGFAPIPTRTAASNTAYNTLISRGWAMSINNP